MTEDTPTPPINEEEVKDSYKTTPVIERAREEREKLEAANKHKEELLNREEAMLAKRALGGESNAGTPTEKKEETPSEYKERVLRGELNGNE